MCIKERVIFIEILFMEIVHTQEMVKINVYFANRDHEIIWTDIK